MGFGFFLVFKKGGFMLNMLVMGVIFISVVIIIILYFIIGIFIIIMVGIFFGVVINIFGFGVV